MILSMLLEGWREKTSRMVLGLREGPSRGVEGRSERLGMLELSSLERFM